MIHLLTANLTVLTTIFFGQTFQSFVQLRSKQGELKIMASDTWDMFPLSRTEILGSRISSGGWIFTHHNSVPSSKRIFNGNLFLSGAINHYQVHRYLIAACVNFDLMGMFMSIETDQKKSNFKHFSNWPVSCQLRQSSSCESNPFAPTSSLLPRMASSANRPRSALSVVSSPDVRPCH